MLDNIIGVSNELSIDDAWQAARLADVDRDIRAMPMGMFTVVGGGGVVSGGQAQRIRIAAALVGNPRILLFDEATSWLDARSQAKVMEIESTCCAPDASFSRADSTSCSSRRACFGR